MKLIKRKISSSEENTIILEYLEWTKELEDICNYIEGRAGLSGMVRIKRCIR